ncbi:hypothetical protein, partial [Streptomyces sp. NPDC019890]|uniref:hypothetical protein n=1 Tax=Streptomyces sp. NPDC019890 TaxID=3365064 RepID=UPI00384EB709
MRWTRAITASLAIVAVLGPPSPTLGVVTPALTDRGPAPDPRTSAFTHSALKPTAASQSATLITGDRVVVRELAQGKQSLTVFPGPGRQDVGFIKQSHTDKNGLPHLVVL